MKNRAFHKAVWVLLVLLVVSTIHVFGQSEPRPDTTRIYKDLKKRSAKSRLGKWLYDAVVVQPKQKTRKKRGTITWIENPYDVHASKIIRHVKVVVLDPFGFSVNDTLRRPNKLERYSNGVHVTTFRFLIRNLLLFEKGEFLDPLRVSESERILRQAPYVNDARIYLQGVDSKGIAPPDSVDALVVVQDKWTLLAEVDANATSPQVEIVEQNFLGTGNSISQMAGYNFEEGKHRFRGRYGLFNFRKSFISSALLYEVSDFRSSYGISLERPFYSPLATWAGGYQAQKVFTYFLPTDTSTVRYPINYILHDGWLGRSWQLTNKKSVKDRSTSLVIGGRVAYTGFTKRPVFELDSFYQNLGQTLFIGSIGISRRQFYKEKYLYRFGANEDVPTGFYVQLKGGYLAREFFDNQYYTGVSFATGFLFSGIGYGATRLEYGSFYNQKAFDKGIIRADFFYFSPLVQQRRWSIRQFASLQTVFGIKRAPYEYINLNGSQLYGFSSPLVKGKNKVILNFETVFYLPYNLLGFRLAPVLFLGFGMIGESFKSLVHSPVYPAFSLGLLVRNENLVFNTFELSVGFYPYLPGGAEGIRFNPISNYNLKVRDFALPRPELVGYY